MELTDYTVDTKAASEGRWFHLDDKECCVRVARWLHPEHAEAMSIAAMSRVERERYARGEAADLKDRSDRTLDQMAEFIFKDFGREKAPDCPGGDKCKGIMYEGVPIENSHAKRREMLERAPSFFADIQSLSVREANFREATIARLEKNSDASSAGSDSGRKAIKRSKTSSKRMRKSA